MERDGRSKAAGEVRKDLAGAFGDHPREGELDERTLVERTQRNADMDAFAMLYRHYVPRIHAFVQRRAGSQSLADDVTSATFERALRNIGSFRWRGAGLGPWLFRIASNELATHYRTESRRSGGRARAAMSALQRDDQEGFEDRVLSGLETEQLRAAVDRLRPRYQQAIVLRYLSGLSNDEAAVAMGTSKTLMAVTLHRALNALRRSIQVEQEPA